MSPIGAASRSVTPDGLACLVHDTSCVGHRATSGIGLAFATRARPPRPRPGDRGPDDRPARRPRRPDPRSKHRVEVDVITADLSTAEGMQRDRQRADRHEPAPSTCWSTTRAPRWPAGSAPPTSPTRTDQLDLLVRAPMHLMDAAIKTMAGRGGGQIINVSSVAAFTPRGVYSAHKAWLLNLSRWADIHYDDVNIAVQALCPGFVRTEFHQRGQMDVSGVPKWMWLKADKVVDGLAARPRAGQVGLDPVAALQGARDARAAPARPARDPGRQARTLSADERPEVLGAAGRCGEGLRSPVATAISRCCRPRRSARPRGTCCSSPAGPAARRTSLPLLPLRRRGGLRRHAPTTRRGQYESQPPAATTPWTATPATPCASRRSTGTRTHVLGHSFGGLVAQQAAVIDPGQRAEPEPAVHRSGRAGRLRAAPAQEAGQRDRQGAAAATSTTPREVASSVRRRSPASWPSGSPPTIPARCAP